MPHAANNRSLVSKCTEGSGVGFLKEPPVSCNVFIQPRKFVINLCGGGSRQAGGGQQGDRKPAVGDEVVFVWERPDGAEMAWHGVMAAPGRLLVLVPGSALTDGSKESFVELLDYAEEVLGCAQVGIALAVPAAVPAGKTAVQAVAPLIRSFAFMGFALLDPEATDDWLNAGPWAGCDDATGERKVVLMAYDI